MTDTDTQGPIRRWIRVGAEATLLLGGAALIGGWEGAILGLAAFSIWGWRLGRPAAFSACLLLAFAALSTVIQVPLTVRNFGITFASRRSIAAAAAQGAGVLALLAVASFARSERVREEAVTPPTATRTQEPGRPSRVAMRHALTGWVGALLVGVVAVAVRVVAAPRALPPGYQEVATNLANGLGFSRSVGGTLVPTALHGPLASLVAAFAPVTPRWSLIVASVLLVAAVGRLAYRIGGLSAAIASGLAAALLPSFWGQQLPESLAALCVTAALVVVWPEEVTARRAAMAGVLLAAGGLARPDALLAVPVAVAWLWRSAPSPARRSIAVLLVAGALTFAPWQLWVFRSVDTWRPTTALGPTLDDATRPAALSGSLIGGAGLLPTLRPAGNEASVDRQGISHGLQRMWDHRLPLTFAARLARGWDLWSPGNARRVRQQRGLPFPGGTIGEVAEIAAALGALAALRAGVIDRQSRFPLVALMVLFTALTLVTFGDRGLRGWAAPAVASSVGCGIAALGRRLRSSSTRPITDTRTAEPR